MDAKIVEVPARLAWPDWFALLVCFRIVLGLWLILVASYVVLDFLSGRRRRRRKAW